MSGRCQGKCSFCLSLKLITNLCCLHVMANYGVYGGRGRRGAVFRLSFQNIWGPHYRLVPSAAGCLGGSEPGGWAREMGCCTSAITLPTGHCLRSVFLLLGHGPVSLFTSCRQGVPSPTPRFPTALRYPSRVWNPGCCY